MYFSREHGDDSLGGRLNFLKFETDRIDTCIDFMRNLVSDHRDNGTAPSDICVMATGGGVYKYYDKITEALGVEVIREDEMESLITGMAFAMRIHDQVLTRTGLDFFINEIPNEVFTYSEDQPME